MTTVNKPLALYNPLPWHLAPLRDKSPIVLLTGSAGGGKSRCAAEKTHAFCLKYPGAMALVLRKAREWVSKSAVPFLAYTVISNDPRVRLLKSESRFVYDNGSVLAWGGMKDDSQREALRSIGHDGALDYVWMEEANAFELSDYEELLGRMRGKSADWRQIILTTNPDAPNHWINQRLIIGGEAHVYYSSAHDNPYNPADYIDTLAKLTGVRHDRLVRGLWVQAEGAIFDNFSIEHNVSAGADYNPALEVIWGVDDGYAQGEGPGTASYHPRVILMAQETAQGGVNVFAEYYHTGELSERTLDNVISWPYALPTAAFVDSSALELKARIWERNVQTVSATHRVSEGIKNVRRLIADGQGVRLLQIHPRCSNLIREMQSYRYDPNSSAVDAGEPKPYKLDDHGPDALRYLCWHLRYAN